MSRFIKWLNDITKEDSAIVGTKAANLGELLSVGMPVPVGFCLKTEAYKHFIETTRLDESISNIILNTNFKDVEQVKEKTAQIRKQFSLKKIPIEILCEIKSAHQKLCEQLKFNNIFVSVRSSATMEDLSNASFAGLYDTYLNISDFDEIIEKIKMCWASLWTEKGFLYMYDHGLNNLEGFMSVVVQQMIQAEVSGILFTANPISGNPFEIIIDSSWGFGEAIVSGTVTPDRFVIDNENLTLKEKRIAEKKVLFTNRNGKNGGMVKKNVPPGKRNLPSLTDSEVIKLGKLGILIKQYYKEPQDIEWTLKDGEFCILQTRPITKLPNYFPVSWEKEEGKKRVWSLAYGQIPFSPFGRSFDLLKKDIYCKAVTRVTRKRFTLHHRVINGYIYINKEFPNHLIIIRWPLQLWSTLHQYYMGRRIYSNWHRSIIPNFIGSVSEMLGSVDNKKSLDDLVVSITQIVKLNVNFHKESVPYDGFCDFFPALLGKLCKVLIPYQQIEYTKLFQGINNKSLEKDRIISSLANMVKRDAVLSSIFAQNTVAEIISQLKKNEKGKMFLIHVNNLLKEEFVFLWAQSNPKDPGWEEGPNIIMTIIKKYINCSDNHDIEFKWNQKIKEREKLTNEIRSKLSSSFVDRIFPVRQIIFTEILRLTQEYYPLKEDQNHYLYRGTWFIRESLLRLGRRLVALGKLNNVEDIFLFSFDEVQKIPVMIKEKSCHFLDLVAERRKEYEKQKRLTPPYILNYLNEECEKKYSENKDCISGLAGSKGIVTGTARLIFSPDQFEKLKKGEILVCPTTRPFWTPLFGLVSGLVTDYGGVLSHGANIAREYEKPAVIGTKIATKVIKDGEKIIVDGTNGKVYFVKE